MDELFILAKGRCDRCDTGNKWVALITRAGGNYLDVAELNDEGFKICQSCIYGLQKEAAVLARFKPAPSPKPTSAPKKGKKKGAKKVSKVTASTGGGGLP